MKEVLKQRAPISLSRSSGVRQVYDKLFCQLLLSSASLFKVQTDVVFACDVAEHLQALSSSHCFAQHPALHYVP